MLDFTSSEMMHGAWVADARPQYKGSYGKISFITGGLIWVVWNKIVGQSAKMGQSASGMMPENLKLLPVGPEPWFQRCVHCGKLSTIKE